MFSATVHLKYILLIIATEVAQLPSATTGQECLTLDGEHGRAGNAHALDRVFAHVLLTGLGDDHRVDAAFHLDLVAGVVEDLLQQKSGWGGNKGV